MSPMGKEVKHNRQTKILFVCHGNICRSPMAEFIMKKLAADAGRDDLGTDILSVVAAHQAFE